MKIPTAAGQIIVIVDIDDVPCLSSDRHHTRVLTAGDERCCHLAIGELALRLDPERFVRVHRISIVNLRAVSRLLRENRRSALRIKGPADSVPVSQSSQAAWMARLGLTAGAGPRSERCLHGRRAKGLRVYGPKGQRAKGPKGKCQIRAEEFFQGTQQADLAEDEILLSIRVPSSAAGTGRADGKRKRKTETGPLQIVPWVRGGFAVIPRWFRNESVVVLRWSCGVPAMFLRWCSGLAVVLRWRRRPAPRPLAEPRTSVPSQLSRPPWSTHLLMWASPT